MKDILNRRLPWSPPSPSGKRLKITKRDLLLFEKFDVHGVLSNPIAYALTRHLGSDYSFLVERTMRLRHDGGYLKWPREQEDTRNARSNYSAYETTPALREALVEAGLRGADEPTVDFAGYEEQFRHRLMTGCITGSIEAMAARAGYAFVPARDISLDFPIPANVEWRGQTNDSGITPDGFFAIDYGEGRRRYFVIEVDRKTMRTRSASLKNRSFERKLMQYRYILTNKRFEKHFGIPNLLVLIFTNNLTHQTNIKECLKNLTMRPNGEYGSNPFLFKYLPEFSGPLYIPPVVEGVWGAYDRVGRFPYDISRITQEWEE
jgi:hypothetical protein